MTIAGDAAPSDACPGKILPGSETLYAAVERLLAEHDAPVAWSIAAQTLLPPGQDFAFHVQTYEQCYGPGSLGGKNAGPAWIPSDGTIDRAHVTDAARSLRLPDYRALHRWSVEHPDRYWEMVIRRLQIRLQQPYSAILDNTNPTAPVWLKGARLNIVENCLQESSSAPAVLCASGTDAVEAVSREELRRLAGRVANGLAALGIGPGDCVGVVMPLTPRAVAIYLGIIAAGAVVVSIAESFAPPEMAARLKVADARLVFTQDEMAWGGRRLGLFRKVCQASAPAAVVLSGGDRLQADLRPGDRTWSSFLSDDECLPIVSAAPQDPINILFSSGTTGDPKAIPWDHTTAIKAAADAHFHHDVRPGDVLCWPTSLGWMMGPWLIFASLLNSATMALYGESPAAAGFGRFVQNAGVTLLGVVPGLVRSWRQLGCMEGFDWSRIRAFSSTGECSNAPDMLYLMHLAGYRPVIEYCGGTEIGGAYVTATLVDPNVPAAFSTPALGLDFEIHGNDPSNHEDAGEAFIRGPSMGLSTRLLNCDHFEVYFEGAPAGQRGAPLRRHGDEIERLPGGYYRVLGRCDDTMNLSGIKVSCAEIERVLNTLPGVLETAAVAVTGTGPARLVVFVVTTAGYHEEDEPAMCQAIRESMCQAIRERLNPLFRISEIRVVHSLPRTASNKVMRRELRLQLEAEAQAMESRAQSG